MSLRLTREELIELTGYRQRSRIFAWLQKNGFRPRLGADRWPRVDRTLYERVVSGSVRNTAAEPNFQFLDRPQGFSTLT